MNLYMYTNKYLYFNHRLSIHICIDFYRVWRKDVKRYIYLNNKTNISDNLQIKYQHFFL